MCVCVCVRARVCVTSEVQSSGSNYAILMFSSPFLRLTAVFKIVLCHSTTLSLQDKTHLIKWAQLPRWRYSFTP